MKIIQITATCDHEGTDMIFGLGDDNQIYYWLRGLSKGEWKLYAK